MQVALNNVKIRELGQSTRHSYLKRTYSSGLEAQLDKAVKEEKAALPSIGEEVRQSSSLLLTSACFSLPASHPHTNSDTILLNSRGAHKQAPEGSNMPRIQGTAVVSW